MPCLSNKRTDWANRLEVELKYATSSHFVTLTYAPEKIPIASDGRVTLRKTDVQKFFKRLRKKLKTPIKYFLCAEYGEETNRPHYHAIIYNLNMSDDKLYLELLKAWQNGLIHVGEVNSQSIRYATKYIIQKNDFKTDDERRPFSLMSKGLGKQYMATHTKYHQDDISRNYMTKAGGTKSRLPRYYRDKVYSQKQRAEQKEQIMEIEANTDFDDDHFTLEIARKEQYKNRVLKSLKNNKL